MPGTAGIQCDGCLAVGIGGYSLGVGVHKSTAIEQRAGCSRNQGNSQRLIQFPGVLVGDFVLGIHEITETRRGFRTKIPGGITGHIYKISAIQNNTIGSDTQVCHSVQIAGFVISKSKQAVLNRQASGVTADSNIVLPLGAIDLFVCVYEQMQGGDIVGTVAVSIVGIVSQSVTGQFYGILQDFQRYRQVNHRLTFVCTGTGCQV